jgi:hypothetical protein
MMGTVVTWCRWMKNCRWQWFQKVGIKLAYRCERSWLHKVRILSTQNMLNKITICSTICKFFETYPNISEKSQIHISDVSITAVLSLNWNNPIKQLHRSIM